jgi:hypothetical protein
VAKKFSAIALSQALTGPTHGSNDLEFRTGGLNVVVVELTAPVCVKDGAHVVHVSCAQGVAQRLEHELGAHVVLERPAANWRELDSRIRSWARHPL